MPVTPVAVNGVLRYRFDIASQDRNMDFWVELNSPGVADYSIKQNLGGTGSDPAATVAQAIWTVLRTITSTSVGAPAWTEFHYDAGTLIPVDSGICTGAGQVAITPKLGTQLTLTFRDAQQHMMRLQQAESVYIPPSNDPALSVGNPLAGVVADVIAVPDGTVSGTWIRTRAGLQPVRALYASVDTNDKYRRARGL